MLDVMPRRPPARRVEIAIDAHRVAPMLYQGAVPPEGHVLRRLGFGMLVLCAIEHQPRGASFPGVRVMHAPFDDAGDPVDRATWETARAASREVAKQLLKGRRVLVTCHKGLNRSGLSRRSGPGRYPIPTSWMRSWPCDRRQRGADRKYRGR